LDGIDAAKDTPVGEMEEDADELDHAFGSEHGKDGVDLEFGEEHGSGWGLLGEGLGGFVDGFGFGGGGVGLGMFDGRSNVKMGVDEGAVEVGLGEGGVGVFGEIGGDWENMRRKLLVKTVKETADIGHFSIYGILQFFECVEGQLDLGERKVKDVPLIDDSGIFGLD
jgi:hypothetical protein